MSESTPDRAQCGIPGAIEHRLRVVHVAPMPFPAPWGSQVFVGRMAQALARRGHDVVVACYSGGEEAPLDGVRVVRGTRVPGGDFSRSGPHWSRPLQDLALSRAIYRLDGVDVFHAHNVEGPLVTRLARVRAPVVYGQHTAMGEELAQWFPLPGVRWLGRAVDWLTPRLADTSLALSRSGMATLPTGSSLCPPGVDLDDLAGADAERARRAWSLGEGPWVVYAGNTDPYQEIDRLVRAMVDVPEAGLLVVGSGPAAPWRELAREVGLPESRVRVVGEASFAQMKDALAVGAVGVCPRRLCRGFPIKLLNQLGLGLPTVCAPGSARPIDGVVVPEDDSLAALAAAIRALVTDPSRCELLSHAARSDVERRWTWDVRAAQLERVYMRLLDRGSYPPATD